MKWQAVVWVSLTTEKGLALNTKGQDDALLAIKGFDQSIFTELEKLLPPVCRRPQEYV